MSGADAGKAPLSKPHYELFAQNVASGMQMGDAYAAAIGRALTAGRRVSATKVHARPEVLDRVAYLRRTKAAASAPERLTGSHLSELMETVTVALTRAAEVAARSGASYAQQSAIRKGIQNSIETVNAIAVDVDGTDKARRVADRIHELGLMAVVYTTHSHVKKKTKTGDRFRFNLFLEEPILFPDAVKMVEGESPPTMTEARRKAVSEYHDRYAGLCEVLGLTDIDTSGMNLHQMMYTPRRPSKDAEFEHYVIYGKALRYEDMPMGDASKYRKAVKAPSGAMLSKKDSVGPAVLCDGFDLREWWGDCIASTSWQMHRPSCVAKLLARKQRFQTFCRICRN